MSKENNARAFHAIRQADENNGEIRIADEVVATIAGMAVTEIKGVVPAVDPNPGLLGAKPGAQAAKNVSITIDDCKVRADVAVVMEYGYSIPKVCGKVQEKVKTAIEIMTGMEVTEVNVKIAGVNIDKSKA